MGEEAITYCRSYALEAERKMGEMLIAGEKTGEVSTQQRKRSTVPSGNSAPVSASDLGISRKEKAEAKMLAEIPDEDFAALKAGKTTKRNIRRQRQTQARAKGKAKRVPKKNAE